MSKLSLVLDEGHWVGQVKISYQNICGEITEDIIVNHVLRPQRLISVI